MKKKIDKKLEEELEAMFWGRVDRMKFSEILGDMEEWALAELKNIKKVKANTTFAILAVLLRQERLLLEILEEIKKKPKTHKEGRIG